MDLSELLSLATEDTLRNFQIDIFVPILVKLLSYEHNPEMMIFAIRCLNYLMEALPTSSGSLVSHGVVPKFCQMLLSLQFIDIAENIFQCLEKLSYDHGAVILKSSGLEAALNALDFFPIETQFVAVRLAANCCRQVAPENWPFVTETTIQTFTGLVSADRDKKGFRFFSSLFVIFWPWVNCNFKIKTVLEQGIVAFSRLADNAFGDSKKIESLSKFGLITNLARILATQKTTLSSKIYTTVIKLLSTLLLNCPDLSKSFFQEGMINIIAEVITDNTATDSNERMIELLLLASEMLPSLPEEYTELVTVDIRSSGGLKKKIAKEQPKTDPRLKIIEENPQFLTQFGEKLLNLLIETFSSSVNSIVRQKCLLIIAKNIHFGASDVLTELLRDIPFSALLAGLLSSNDTTAVALSLKMCEVLLEKLPKIFLVYFTREGVISKLEALSQAPSKSFEPKETDSKAYGLPKRSNAVDDWIVKHSNTLKNTHFSQGQSMESESFQKIKSILPTLESSLHFAAPAQKEKEAMELVAKVLASEEGITPYELTQSSLIDHLLNFLTVSDKASNEKNSNFTLQAISTLEERAKLFFKIFCHPIQENTSSPFLLLVRKLQSALNTAEDFQVVIGDYPGVPQTLKYLTQPIKVQFQMGNPSFFAKTPHRLHSDWLNLTLFVYYITDSSETKYEPWGGNYTLVEPLAKIDSMTQFLLPRITSKKDDLTLAMLSEPEPPKKENSTEKKHQSQSSEEEYEDDDEEEEDYMEEENDVEEQEIADPAFKELGLNLVLKLGNIQLKASDSLFKVLQNQICNSLNEKNLAPQPLFKLWETVHNITYSYALNLPTNSEKSVSLSPFESSYAKLVRRVTAAHSDSTCLTVLRLLALLDYFNNNAKAFSDKPIVRIFSV